MNKRFVLVGVVLAAVVWAPAARAEPPGSADARAITAVLDAQAAAWNRGDLEGYMDGYWKSPDLVFTSGGRVERGWQPTYDRYRQRYGTSPATMGALAFDGVEVHALGPDAAWLLGRWQLTFPDRRTGGVFTLVVRRIDGRWLVVHDHTSTSPD